MSVQERVDKLHALLTEALVVQARIMGEVPSVNVKAEAEETPTLVLDVLEFDLGRALDKAWLVVEWVRRIEQRLQGEKEADYAGSGS